VGSSAISWVIWVKANTNTRSKNSSKWVTWCDSSVGCTLGAVGDTMAARVTAVTPGGRDGGVQPQVTRQLA